MYKKIAAAAGVTGLLALGTAGVASAVTSPSGATAPSSAHQHADRTFSCANAPEADAKLAKLDARLATWEPKLKAAEATQSSEGHTFRADRLALILHRVERIQVRVDHVQSAIDAKCGTSTSSQTN